MEVKVTSRHESPPFPRDDLVDFIFSNFQDPLNSSWLPLPMVEDLLYPNYCVLSNTMILKWYNARQFDPKVNNRIHKSLFGTFTSHINSRLPHTLYDFHKNSIQDKGANSKYAGLCITQFRVQVHVEVCVLLSCARHFIPTMPLSTTEYKSVLTIYFGNLKGMMD